MKKTSPFCIPSVCALFILFSLFSCTSAKKLTYFQDLTPNETLKGLPRPAPVYKIRLSDNLFVGIYSQDPEMNKLYDPSGTSNQASVAFEGAASRAVNGNIVSPDGTISLPALGKIKVEGKTIREAEELIHTAAKEFLKEVSVKVRVLTYKITVIGEVKVPGVYYNYNDYLTIFDAIALAQGTTDFAKLQEVLVTRNIPGGTKTYTMDLNSKTSFQSDGYYLLPGDVVFLQPARNKGLAQKLPLAGVIVGSISALLLLLNYLNNK